jgi:hypothetical protein
VKKGRQRTRDRKKRDRGIDTEQGRDRETYIRRDSGTEKGTEGGERVRGRERGRERERVREESDREIDR